MDDVKQISTAGKIIAGCLLIFFTSLAIYLIIGYWPDKLPKPGDKCAIYSNNLFHVTLKDSCTGSIKSEERKSEKDDSSKATTNNLKQRNDSLKADSLKKDSLKNHVTATVADTNNVKQNDCNCSTINTNTIDLNTLLLILVALAGFLGNMIHITTSFTTFVGAESYKKSWLLWYFVRPFTASALAIALYFVFRGGFLNYSNASNINIYGVMTMSMLAGLFTDIATQKLKEIFEAAFKPQDKRPDALEDSIIQITEVTPDKIDKTKENELTVKGKNLDKQLIIKINSEPVINLTIKSDVITIKYGVPVSQSAATEFKLEIFDKNSKLLYSKILKT